MGEPSNHGFKKLVGRCIYCDGPGPYTDEHVVPAALGGIEILLKASCETCQKPINEEVENPAMRMYRAVRYQDNIGRRRKKGRPKSEVTRVSYTPVEHPPSNLSEVVKEWPEQEVAFAQRYNFIVLPELAPAGMMRGLTPEESFGSGHSPLRSYFRDPATVTPPDGVAAMFTKVDFHFDVFFRSLAKIAHCYAVYHEGLGAFRPYLVDLILGRELYPKALHLIGGGAHTRTDRVTQYFGGRCRINHGIKNQIICGIQLFGYLDTQWYTVVVGELPE